MLLKHLSDSLESNRCADDAMRLIKAMFPLCRSITGNGVRQTMDLVEQLIPLQRSEVASGTPAFDWVVPNEWNIRDAYIADSTGRRIVDFGANNLHVVGYSVPVDRTMSLEELQPHLHSLPAQPDWIPYRTSNYKEDWGFCLRHSDRQRLLSGTYRVVVDSTLAPGSLTYAECVIEGSESGEALIYTHTCHPSLANDNLTGIAVAAVLARALRSEQPRMTWRFIFGPGTIGSLTWLARNEQRLPKIRAGLTVGLLGNRGALTYKRSRRGNSVTDHTGEYLINLIGEPNRVVDFEPYGYDERQFCSPGFDLPVGRLSRASHGGYREYHTSADDLSLLRTEDVAESIQVLARMVAALDVNRRPLNLNPKGEPWLGKRGLYGAVGGTSPGELQHALLWVMSLADGAHDLIAMARRSGLSLELLDRAAATLEQAGLVRTIAEELQDVRGLTE